MGGMTGLLLLLWAGVTVGRVVDLQKRIIGGDVCSDEERLYHVQLRAASPDRFICGASLISDEWILTAAHCWKETLYAMVNVHPGPGTPVAITDHHFLVDRFLFSKNKKHDLMLLKINNPDNIPLHVVQLPNCKSRPEEGDEVQIAGHASTDVGDNDVKLSGYSKTLQCAKTDIINCDEVKNCLKKIDPVGLEKSTYEHWLCYKRENVDTSTGDSGGGVVYRNRIYGVHVKTGNPVHACAAAGASMDICEELYMDWIKKTIKPKKGCFGFGCGIF